MTTPTTSNQAQRPSGRGTLGEHKRRYRRADRIADLAKLDDRIRAIRSGAETLPEGITLGSLVVDRDRLEASLTSRADGETVAVRCSAVELEARPRHITAPWPEERDEHHARAVRRG